MSEFECEDVLSAQNLGKSFRQGPQRVQVFSGVDLAVRRGESVAIVGTSGAGKSTLLNLLAGLERPSEGFVCIEGRQFSQLRDRERDQVRNRRLGFVYQFHHLLPEFDALENVCMPLLIARQAPAEARALAAASLQQVGLAARFGHKPAELSGGERARVAIARALVASPACVLMDEPTGNLDGATARNIQNLIHRLRRELGISFVVVTHDERFAHSMGRVLCLDQGRLLAQAEVDAGV